MLKSQASYLSQLLSNLIGPQTGGKTLKPGQSGKIKVSYNNYVTPGAHSN